jgi:toxin ParE1/3/4
MRASTSDETHEDQPMNAFTVHWLPTADQNRADQLDYIAQRNPIAAIGLDEEIERQTDMLREQPKLGRPGRVTGTRELVISATPYILVYRLTDNSRVEVLRLLHSSQQWPPA